MSGKFREVHEKLFRKMLTLCKSSRTRCLAIRDGKMEYGLDFCTILQPFEATSETRVIWESPSLRVIEWCQPIDASLDYNSFLNKSSWDFSNRRIDLPPVESVYYHSDLFRGESWLHRYPTRSNGIALKKDVRIPTDFEQSFREKVSDEIEFHPVRPYWNLESFGIDMLGTSRNFLKEGLVELAAPFWVRITSVKVDAKDRSIRCVYEIAQTVHESGRLRAWHSYALRNSSFLITEIGWKLEKGQDVTRQELRYSSEVELALSMNDILSIVTTISLDGEFALHSQEVQLEVGRHMLWPTIMKIDATTGGRMVQFLAGATDHLKCDGFELAMMNLLSSLGFRTALVGPLSQSGVDILALPTDEDYMLLVECSRAGVKQKVADCSRSLDKLRGAFPHYRFRGVVMIAEKVPKITRDSIGRSDIVVLDADDIGRLREYAELKPDTSALMDVVKGITDTVREMRSSRW